MRIRKAVLPLITAWRVLLSLSFATLIFLPNLGDAAPATSLLHVLDSSDLIVVADYAKGARLPEDWSSAGELTLNIETVIMGRHPDKQLDVKLLPGGHPVYKDIRIGPNGKYEWIYDISFVAFLKKSEDGYIWHFTAWDIGPRCRVDESSRLMVYGYQQFRGYSHVDPTFVTLHQLNEYAKSRTLTYRFSGEWTDPETKLDVSLGVEVTFDGRVEDNAKWHSPSTVSVSPTSLGPNADICDNVRLYEAGTGKLRYTGKPSSVNPMTGVIQVEWSKYAPPENGDLFD